MSSCLGLLCALGKESSSLSLVLEGTGGKVLLHSPLHRATASSLTLNSICCSPNAFVASTGMI